MILDEREIKAQRAKQNETDIHKRMYKRLDIRYGGKRMQQEKEPRKNKHKANGEQDIQDWNRKFSHAIPYIKTDNLSSICYYNRIPQKRVKVY